MFQNTATVPAPKKAAGTSVGLRTMESMPFCQLCVLLSVFWPKQGKCKLLSGQSWAWKEEPQAVRPLPQFLPSVSEERSGA